MPLGGTDDLDDGRSVALTLYAHRAGAFVDLAVDLAWLTGCTITDFALDQYPIVLRGPESAAPIRAASVINQAIGVLIGALSPSPSGAHQELDAGAAVAGTGRLAAAHLILNTVTKPEPGPDVGV